MPVLSIIACDMLEDEVAYVLSKDDELEQLILLEKKECFGLQRKLRSLGCIPAVVPLDRVQEILRSGKKGCIQTILEQLFGLQISRDKMKVTVVVNILKMGLHMDVKMLRSEVNRNIREMSRFSDRILIFYGTCGHSLVNIGEDLEDLKCKLYFLKDDKGEIVEDCISAALGGNDAYAKAMVDTEGESVFYLTPMWASGRMEIPKEMISEISGLGKIYFKRYGKVGKINTGLSYEADFDENVRDFARSFDLKIVEIQGSLKAAEQSYHNARRFL